MKVWLNIMPLEATSLNLIPYHQ